MKKAISKALLRLAGWRISSTEGVETPKCVICVAPHTSNWDFIVGKLFYTSIGCNANFLIKKEWFFFPFNLLFNALGGVPIDRSNRTSVTEQMVNRFNSSERMQLAITPEGTRKRVETWKKGFYFIACAAKVPILIAYMDYGKKEAGTKGLFYPTGDIEKDLPIIQAMFKGVTARYPEQFAQG